MANKKTYAPKLIKKKDYIPKRQDIIWIDFQPSKGKEMNKYRPALVLSSKEYNRTSELLVCCPISTSIRNAPAEVPIDIDGNKSVIKSHLISTLSWKNRGCKYINKVNDDLFKQVLIRLIPIIGGGDLIT